MQTGPDVSADVSEPAPPSRREPLWRRRGPLFWTIVGLALVVLLLVVMTVQAFNAVRHLNAAGNAVTDLRTQAGEGDLEGLGATADRIADEASSARGSVHGPHWWLASGLPVVGDDIGAVRTVTDVVDEVARDALPSLVEAAAVIDPASFAPQDGRIDLAPLEEAAPHVRTAAAAVLTASDRMHAIELAELSDPMRRAVRGATNRVDSASSLTTTAAKAAELLPPMLGAEGPRHYLLLAQNNAEPRALGGLNGALILVRANGGKVDILEHTTGGDVGATFEELPVRLTSAEQSLFGTQLGRFIQNTTATPDFPRAGQLTRSLWREATGRRVDGVAAIDPVALQMVLAGTGPVRVPGDYPRSLQRLTKTNAAQRLLNQTYIDIPDPDPQNEYFADAAAAIFGKVMSGSGDLGKTVQALARATDQGRVLLWAAEEQEQQVIAGTAIAGELTPGGGGPPVVGVYLHDRTPAKIAYYQDLDVKVRPVSCEAGSAQEVTVTVSLASTVPRNITSLPTPLTGAGVNVPIGHVSSEVYLYAPEGATITDFDASNDLPGVATNVHDGHHVAARTFSLAPREEVTFEYRIRLAEPIDQALRIRTTPGPTTDGFSRSSLHCP